jgi:hypothetical protein
MPLSRKLSSSTRDIAWSSRGKGKGPDTSSVTVHAQRRKDLGELDADRPGSDNRQRAGKVSRFRASL